MSAWLLPALLIGNALFLFITFKLMILVEAWRLYMEMNYMEVLDPVLDTLRACEEDSIRVTPDPDNADLMILSFKIPAGLKVGRFVASLMFFDRQREEGTLNKSPWPVLTRLAHLENRKIKERYNQIMRKNEDKARDAWEKANREPE